MRMKNIMYDNNSGNDPANDSTNAMEVLMSYRDNYLALKKRQETLKANPMSGIFFHQEKRYVAPFRIYGNVHYVGDSWVCVHLIDTGDGLLLIDSGNVCATPWLVQAIWEAGFRPNDVKWIILSHGHIDHVGGAVFFRDTFGTKLYLGEPDARMYEEKPEFSYIQDSPCLLDDVFVPDEVIRDGDVLRFGNTEISCYLVPGHTPGCVALFFDAVENGVVKRCGYYGGFGFNTLTVRELDEFGDTEHTMWKTYEESILHVIDQKTDIFLGNHADNNHTLEKREKYLADPSVNPFIDPDEWKTYLSGKIDELHAFVAAQTSS